MVDKHDHGSFDNAAPGDVAEGTESQNETTPENRLYTADHGLGSEERHPGQSPVCGASRRPDTPLTALTRGFAGVLRAERFRRALRPDTDPVTAVLADRARVVFDRAKSDPSWADVAQLNKIAGELEHG